MLQDATEYIMTICANRMDYEDCTWLKLHRDTLLMEIEGKDQREKGK